MSEERQPKGEPAHMEKPIMTEPQEEFVADQSVPSRDVSEPRKKPARQPGPEK